MTSTSSHEWQTTGAADPETMIEPLDAWLSSDGAFRAPYEEGRAKLVDSLLNVLTMHMANNSAYSAYAKALKFDLSEFSEESLDRVPLVPAGAFKRMPEVLRTPGKDVVDTTSSGTQGTVSRIPRDNTTMMRFFASVAAGTKELLDLEHSETMVYSIGPTIRESRHLWISYVMAGVSVLHDTDFYVADGQLQAKRLMDDLRTASPHVPSLIVGPPPMLWDLTRKAAESGGLPSHPRRYVITIGGWKRRSGEMVERKMFDAHVSKTLGLAGTSHVRDAFNMVELNTIILECEHHTKHCPPWLYVTARDPWTLKATAERESGVLGYLDPTPTSFPGMILSEDFGWVERKFACPCGVVSDTLHIERRINRLESRGCAMKI